MTQRHERRDLERDKVAEASRLFRMAQALQLEGDVDRALILYEKSLRLHATAEAHAYLGWAKSSRGLLDDAVAHCKKAIALDAEFPNAWNDIGAYLIDLGEPDEALFFLKRATRMKANPAPCFPHYNLYRAYAALGDRARAITHLNAALAADPDFAPAVEALAEMFRPGAARAAGEDLRVDAGTAVLSFRPRRS